MEKKDIAKIESFLLSEDLEIRQIGYSLLNTLPYISNRFQKLKKELNNEYWKYRVNMDKVDKQIFNHLVNSCLKEVIKHTYE